MRSRRRRATHLRPDGLAPAPHAVAAAREAVLARTLATLRQQRGEDVEIPPRDHEAEALVLADAAARGIDVEQTRADLVDRIARAVGAE